MLCMHFRHVCVMFFVSSIRMCWVRTCTWWGPPGPLRRHLALAYCELTGREMEYVSLSRDTTETDLKQRREIVAGTVHYVDQVSVCVSLSLSVIVCVSLIPLYCTHSCVWLV